MKWSSDGAGLATCGEDGSVKIWSKNGELRSKIYQGTDAVYCLAWSPDCNHILYSYSCNLEIAPISTSAKNITWKAHDGIVTKVDWNICNNLIASVGEDCKYKIWDQYGRNLFVSSPHTHILTSVAWSPNGENFAVGSFDTLRLCDKAGWTHSFSKPRCGSINKITWNSDGSIISCAGGNGSVLFGYLIDQRISNEGIEATVEDDNKVSVTDVVQGASEELDFKDRVIAISAAYKHIVVVTTAQCYVYTYSSWTNPYIMDVKDSVLKIIQGAKYFALIDISQGFNIYTYECKLAASPKYPGMRVEYLNERLVSLTCDVAAIIDTTNPKIIRLFEISTGKPWSTNIEHSNDVVELALNHSEMDRKIAFTDSNKDLFISPIAKVDIYKIGTMAETIKWNAYNDALACFSDGKLIIWGYPNCAYIDKDILEHSKQVTECSNIGRFPTILSYIGNLVEVRKMDGTTNVVIGGMNVSVLYHFIEKSQWNEAVRLCRFIKDPMLWGCLSGMSLAHRELDTAENALASINELDKVQYINKIKELPSNASKNAAISLFCGKSKEAESNLLSAKLYYRAIKMNIKLFKWERALEIALSYKTHIDTVIAYRTRYLQQENKKEELPKFLQVTDKIDINWETIKEKIKKDKEGEKSA